MAAFTAAANDAGWVNVFSTLFREHRLTAADALLVLSVGGGTEHADHDVSHALVWAVRNHTGQTFAILGRDGGAIGRLAHVCVRIPPLYPEHVTPHTEGLTSVILHCLVTHPALQKCPPTWEGLQR
jgi:D-sedoheptulose 7-phosphate isomerase